MSEQNKGYTSNPDKIAQTGNMTKPQILAALFNHAVKSTDSKSQTRGAKLQSIEEGAAPVYIEPDTVELYVRKNTRNEDFKWDGTSSISPGALLNKVNIRIPVDLEKEQQGQIDSKKYDGIYGEGAAQLAIDQFDDIETQK